VININTIIFNIFSYVLFCCAPTPNLINFILFFYFLFYYFSTGPIIFILCLILFFSLLIINKYIHLLIYYKILFC
jgi:hypothetical protein